MSIGTLIGLGVLAGGLFLLGRWIHGSSGGGGGASTRKLRREVKRCLAQGEFVRAGEILDILGETEEAIKLFLRGGSKRLAAEGCERMGNQRRAAKLYQEMGDYRKAGLLFEKANDLVGASECYDAGDMKGEAASAYERLGKLSRAAQLYDGEGEYAKAADLYQRAGDDLLAAQTFLKAYDTEAIRATRGMAGAAQVLDYARRGASLFRKVGESERALALLRKAGLLSEMAVVLGELRRHEEAADCYIEGGQREEAARALERAGKKAKAMSLLGDVARDKCAYQEAARHYASAGDLLAAGDMLREAGDLVKAGQAYERGGDWPHAAEMYLGAGAKAEAARAYEAAGKLDQALDLYRQAGLGGDELRMALKAGNYLRAGELLLAQGDRQRAMEALQRVPEGDGAFAQACLLLGHIFSDIRDAEMSLRFFRLGLRGRPVDEGTVDAYYKMARILEIRGDTQEAVGVYNQIMERKYGYKDVRERLKALQSPQGGSPLPVAGPGIADSQRYQILHEIGKGGMGLVYKAKDDVLGRVVAMKVLAQEIKNIPEASQYFLREARAAAALNHPNIVTVFDVYSQGDQLYIVMEYVEGKTMEQILKANGPLHHSDISKAFFQICQAITYAHNQGIIHRDIKPANIMLTANREMKIMDFGLAKVIHESGKDKSLLVGTPLYMSPEQLLGQEVDLRSDIYSLGITIYELATGQPPFSGESVVYHQVNTPPPSPRSILPSIPEYLEQAILRCLSKDREHRFQSAQELLAALVPRW